MRILGPGTAIVRVHDCTGGGENCESRCDFFLCPHHSESYTARPRPRQYLPTLDLPRGHFVRRSHCLVCHRHRIASTIITSISHQSRVTPLASHPHLPALTQNLRPPSTRAPPGPACSVRPSSPRPDARSHAIRAAAAARYSSPAAMRASIALRPRPHVCALCFPRHAGQSLTGCLPLRPMIRPPGKTFCTTELIAAEWPRPRLLPRPRPRPRPPPRLPRPPREPGPLSGNGLC